MSLAAMGIPGRNILPYRSGYGAQVIANADPRAFNGFPAGASLDWNLVSAAGSDITLPDTELILTGWRYLRYGQVMCRVTGAGFKVLTITGSPTGGTWTITITNSAMGASAAKTTAGISPTASAGDVRAALEALPNVGYGNAIVTGGAGGPYNITLAAILGTSTFATSGAGLTGGTSPATAFSNGAGGNSRFFGPYDPGATDGRQSVNAGDCFIMNRTKVLGGSLQLPLGDDTHTGECVTAGYVWRDKVIATTGTHSATAGPTWTELRAALPLLQPVSV
jgi:hypothetical protein